MNNLQLTNSLTNKKEIFQPINKDKVSLYSCGPTVYDDPHVGNARALVVFDLLYRILIELYGEKKVTYLEKCLGKTEGPILAASDYMRMNSDQIRPYTSKSFYSLGTDGYGRSDTRKNLRRFFEVDKEHIVAYGLSVLANEQLMTSKYAEEAIKKYNIDKNKPIPTKL